MKELPRPIFDHVAEAFNCEDIAMSFMVSSLTDGRPPLLASFWAIESMIKLFVPKKISGTKNHKAIRDECVDSFAQQLNLKDRLYTAPILHRNDTMFYCGDKHYYNTTTNLPTEINWEKEATPRQRKHMKQISQWRRHGIKEMRQVIASMKNIASAKAKLAGLLEHTDEWKATYGRKG
jgi:Glycosyl transferase family 64 domain